MPDTAVTVEEVAACYHALLGRAPESDAVVQQHVAAQPSLEQFMRQVLTSPEFISRFHPTIDVKQLRTPPEIRVDVDGTPEQIERLVAHTRKVWADYGKADPFYSVITKESFHADRIGQAEVEEFYASGAESVADIRNALVRNRISSGGFASVLDFGCGLGRVGEHLSAAFPRYIGVDISPPHLAQAAERLAAIGRANARFQLLPDYLAAPEPVDLIFSLIVLQHNPPPLIAILLDALCKVLKPDGVLYVQIPVALFNYSFDLEAYLADLPADGTMEMHCLPQRDIFRILGENGCTVMEAFPDNKIGDVGLSYTFVARKG